MVVGRRVLGAYVMALCGGSGMSEQDQRVSGGEDNEDVEKWEEQGKQAFKGEKGEEVRREAVEGVLGAQGMAGWCDEQVSSTCLHIIQYQELKCQTTVLRRLHAHILQQEEDWVGAARALTKIPLEGGSRYVSWLPFRSQWIIADYKDLYQTKRS